MSVGTTPEAWTSEYRSPVGVLCLRSDGTSLTGIGFPERPFPGARDDALAVFRTATEQLDAYFAGELRTFALTIALTGTDFQRAVWAALQTIPFGTTISYAELARRIGRPSAIRAVGAANGQNPIAIVVPCHRVIGADGGLTGYGGGIGRKRWLLEHEQGLVGLFREGRETSAGSLGP